MPAKSIVRSPDAPAPARPRRRLRGDAHVVEEARRVQRADGFGCLVVGEGIALLDRQVREHRARLDALQAFDADVLHHERCRCMRREAARRAPQPQLSWYKR
jgi:hypothetical protein